MVFAANATDGAMQRNHPPAPVQCYPQAPYNAIPQASYNAIPQYPYSTMPPPPYNAIPQPPHNATTAASHNARNAHRDVPVTTVIRACRTAGFGKWRWRLGATTGVSFSYIYSTNTAATAKSPPPWRPLNSVGFLARIFFFVSFLRSLRPQANLNRRVTNFPQKTEGTGAFSS